MELILKSFPDLTFEQLSQFERLLPLYSEWNEKINVVSRKDIDQLEVRHVLHSLAIAKFIQFVPQTKVLDIGTGGGFPGIPLAILFPNVSFTLVDSIDKKIRVVREISVKLNLGNVHIIRDRAENIPGKFDFVTCRAVAHMKKLIHWTKNKYSEKSKNALSNGLIALKGGDLSEELNVIRQYYEIKELADYFDQRFFETKKLVYIKMA